MAATLAAIMSFYAIGDRQNGYYQLLRYVIFISGVLTAYCAYLFKGYLITVLSVLIALVFNPFAQIYLQKDTWQSIDIVAGLYFGILVITFVLEYLKSDFNSSSK